MLHLVDVAVHGLALPGGGDQVYILALGSQHHEGDTKYRVGPRGEDGHLHVAASHLKFHLGTLAVAYPVALGLLDRVAPVERVEVAQQAAGIGRHAQAPLVHHLLHHRVAATQRHTLAHLVVGQHCAQLGAPVHHGLAAVGDAIVHEHLLFLHLGEGLPLLGRELGVVASGTGGRVAALAAVLLKVGHQLLDGAGLVEGGVVVALKHLEEGPLRPLVVLGVAGAHLAAPVEAEPYLVELLAVAVDVFHRGHLGVLPRLYGILLGRQPVGIIAHGVKHVVALQSLVAGIDVAGYIAQRDGPHASRPRWGRETCRARSIWVCSHRCPLDRCGGRASIAATSVRLRENCNPYLFFISFISLYVCLALPLPRHPLARRGCEQSSIIILFIFYRKNSFYNVAVYGLLIAVITFGPFSCFLSCFTPATLYKQAMHKLCC